MDFWTATYELRITLKLQVTSYEFNFEIASYLKKCELSKCFVS